MSTNELAIEVPKDPVALEARRHEIITTLNTKYGGYNHPDVPLELLRELAFVVSKLRRPTSGPPLRPKTAATKRKTLTIDDLD